MNYEKVSLSRARIKKAGKNFEIVIDPKAAVAFKEGKLLDVKEVLKDVHIYTDANKGMKCSAEDLKTAFGTDDSLEAAKEIIRKGDIQLTAEQRGEKREQLRREIIQLIKRNAIDPRTKTPMPETRIENAFAEAKIRIDDTKPAEAQLSDIIKQLQPILPIKFETKIIQVHIPAQYAQKTYGTIKKFGTIKKEEWLNDGSWTAQVEIPGGLETDFYDILNKLTQGDITTKVME